LWWVVNSKCYHKAIVSALVTRDIVSGFKKGIRMEIIYTRVLLKTDFRRGKSEMPASRIEIDESRRESEDRRELTDAPSD
jgi:hypothetical protein